MKKDITHGFRLVNQSWIEEVDSECFLYEHILSGAHLMILQNKDDNKVFSAAFRTPPADDTGAPHIVEHCVLSGSRKYHTKEPFMDMVKGSMNTFINAMTFSDKTIYPVASKIEKDFFQLMDVYLDAVFFPSMIEDPTIFLQEGWRYHMTDCTSPIEYKGIVYNEMKGGYANPERELMYRHGQHMMKGSCYEYESGGHPAEITQLSYEAFCQFYRTYYHPSNAYLYVYGDVDVRRVLKHLDSEYLSLFNAKPMTISYDCLPTRDYVEFVEGEYPVQEQSEAQKDFMSYASVAAKKTDPLASLTVDVLCDILVESSASPLRKALVAANFADDIQGYYDDGLYKQFGIILKNTDGSRRQEFYETIQQTLIKISEEGINEDLLLSGIHRLEFNLREADEFHTKGIIYHMASMETWLYGDQPTGFLSYQPLLEQLHQKGYFEQFIKDHLIKTTNATVTVLKPSVEYYHQQVQREKEQLQQVSEKEDLQVLIEQSMTLEKKQLSPDSAEAIATIPTIQPSDIEEKPHFVASVKQTSPFVMLHSELFTGGIGYIDIAFDLGHVVAEDLLYVKLISQMLGEVGTTKHHYDVLSNNINLSTGGIQVDILPYSFLHAPYDLKLKLMVRTKANPEYFGQAIALLKEILTETQFTNTARLQEKIVSLNAGLERAMNSAGNTFAMRRARSYLSTKGRIGDLLNGVEYVHFIKSVSELPMATLAERLTDVFTRLISTRDVVVSFTGSEAGYCQLKPFLDELMQALPEREQGVHYLSMVPHERQSEGVVIASDVQYVAQAYEISSADYHGSLQVLSTLLSTSYLHDRVRAKGGAYGCNATVANDGFVGIASYRDPHINETYEIYGAFPSDLKEMPLTQEEVNKLIVGTMSQVDGAKTPRQQGGIALGDYLIGRTPEDVRRVRQQILSTTPEQLKMATELMSDFVRSGIRCTFGSKAALQQSGRFDKITE